MKTYTRQNPLLVVNGTPYHYHELEIGQPYREEQEQSTIDRLAAEDEQVTFYRPSFPFHLTIKTYLAPAVGEQSIYRVRRWRAESYSREVYVGNVPASKPGRERERLVFENAVEGSPVEHEIRRRTPNDLRPGWSLTEQHRCHYIEQGAKTIGRYAPAAIACHRPATHMIMFCFPGTNVAEHFGYICEHHGPLFRAFIEETYPDPGAYTYRRLHGGK